MTPRPRFTPALEHVEQVRFVAHCRAFYPDLIVAAVPNGGKRGAKEAKRLKAEGVLPGYPDLLIDEPRGPYHGLRIEMKRGDGKGAASPAQRDVIRRLRRRGYRVEACVGAGAAIDVLEAYLLLPPPPLPLD